MTDAQPEPSVRPATSTVVVVDDDIVSALCLEALLKREGFDCRRAGNGPAGRALVGSHHPDLVLLDIQMPGEDGLEACRRLKADPSVAEIPVIFLTGSEDLGTKLAGFQAGAVDYITKPYEAAEVLARIQVHIRARRMARLLVESQMAQLDRLASAQQAILTPPSSLPQARFAVFYRPYAAAGGDFYEVLQAGDEVYDYVVADVSGHDADASLVTAALKVLLQQGQATLSSPLETLRMVNRALRSSFPDHVYLTLAWVRLNRRRMMLTTLLAGHPPPLFLSGEGGDDIPLGTPGEPLGCFDSVDLEESQRKVQAGDRLLLFTDGLLELVAEDGTASRSRGLARLTRALGSRRGLPLAEFVPGIAEELLHEARVISDDVLLLAVEA